MKDNFCIDSISDCNQINKSQLNDSLSKHLWSFSKSPRFTIQKSSCDRFYQIPSFITPKKGAGLGYGMKYDFTQDLTNSPPSSKYDIKSQFLENQKKKKGFSISIGRQLSQRNGYIELQPLKMPGPGSYKVINEQNNKSGYTIRMRTKILDRVNSLQPQNNYPGPGKYDNPQSISKEGKYFITKFKDSQATLFAKEADRFGGFKNNIPGPGAYISKQNDFSQKGRYILSKNHGNGTRPFGNEKRENFVDSFSKIHKNPGPGSYRLPSDFGHYDKRQERDSKERKN